MTATSAKAPGALRIFVSYSRADGSELATELLTALEVLGFDGFLDRTDIAAAEDWERRLDALIRQSDTVVFIITPRSVESERCAWEVERATMLSKRIVPVVGIPVQDSRVPAALQRLHHIQFGTGHSFARSLGQLADALRLDVEWIREHTRLAELARRWTERGFLDALLLRGDELTQAEAWMARWTPGAPPVTDAHRAFVAASAEAESHRASLERRRVEEMARANEERAEALGKQALAIASLRRRTLQGGAVAGVFAAGLGGMGWWSLRLRQRADEAEKESIARRARLESLRTDIGGQIVAYAALPGQPAMDGGPDGLSPYTSALLRELGTTQNSLWTAVSRASTRVAEATGGRQRPFISSDMNGDLYLRQRSPTRKLRAIVIGVGKLAALGIGDLSGVYRDIEAWRHFLTECGFDVAVLRDPTLQQVGSAVRTALQALGRRRPSIRPVGVLAEPRVETPKREPLADSLMVVFYSGYGFRANADRYLAVADTVAGATQKGVPDVATAVSASDLEASLRASFAASLLVFDTNFI